ncbi:MutS family DNA mismatch repair protein [soil metagenome]
MQIDQTTLNDLSLFNHDDELSILHKLDFTRTTGGKSKLKYLLSHPLSSISAITDVQKTIQIIRQKKINLAENITNGTLMVIHKFYEAVIDEIPQRPTAASTLSYTLLHNADFSLVKYSASHFADLITGIDAMIKIYPEDERPLPLQNLLLSASQLLNLEPFHVALNKKFKDFSNGEILQFVWHVRNEFKQQIFQLADIFYQLDAWYSMAAASEKFNLCFPEFIENNSPSVTAKGLYHLLLTEPVGYDITLDKDQNFIFLTGANMAGKSTFIKSVGAAVFLAHTGIGVPAKQMKLTFFDGMLSNINVMDNIVKGESYFFNEVQRIKNTIIKINDGKKWLVLIDELFKGTNVQDAMKCSTVVIKGLVKIPNSLYILSTHLYEIGDELQVYKNISFRYFETSVNNEQLEFSYQLKEGVSNDRLGYLILKREKVIELLESL